MTCAEAVFALTKMPDSIYDDMQEAATVAERYWTNVPDVSARCISIAKAAAVEVTLLFGGALPIIQQFRRHNLALSRKPDLRD